MDPVIQVYTSIRILSLIENTRKNNRIPITTCLFWFVNWKIIKTISIISIISIKHIEKKLIKNLQMIGINQIQSLTFSRKSSKIRWHINNTFYSTWNLMSSYLRISLSFLEPRWWIHINWIQHTLSVFQVSHKMQCYSIHKTPSI